VPLHWIEEREMEIPDLTRFSPDHPPSPYGFPLPLKSGDTWGIGHLPEGSTLLSVGWLGSSVKSNGPVAEDVVEALLEAYDTKACVFRLQRPCFQTELLAGTIVSSAQAPKPGTQTGKWVQRSAGVAGKFVSMVMVITCFGTAPSHIWLLR
jgi:hypothetical protein